MILETLVTWGLNFVNMVLDQINILPEIDGYLAFAGAISNVWGYLDSFIDLGMVIFVIAQVVIVDNIQFIINLFAWVWEKLPFN